MMITAILYKVIPWWFEFNVSEAGKEQFAFFSGAEMFVEVVAIIVVSVGLIMALIEKKKGGGK